MNSLDNERLTLDELDDVLRAADPAVLLIAPRILRRVIRLDGRITAFGFRVPHGTSYVILRERLFDCVSRFELELDAVRALPDTVLLLRRPDDEELEVRPVAEVLFDYWRLLFHIRIHLELQRRVAAGRLTEDDVLDRLRRIGSSQYAEIRSVLQRDDLLLPPKTDLSTYVEFVAVFLERFYFAPEQLPWHFPSLGDHEALAAVLADDLDHPALYHATRLPQAERPALRREPAGLSDAESLAVESATADPLQPSPPAYWRLIARAERSGLLGNTVKAAILRWKASRVALPDRVQPMKSLAIAELDRLASRLQQTLQLTKEETLLWAEAITPLLQHVDSEFRSSESRLLYDLQKACLEHERGVFKIDLWRWCRSLGKDPLRRPLSLLREVMVTKHLQSAARKLTTSRLTGDARKRLSQLIETAVAQAQRRLRDQLRPILSETLASEGLEPRNVPERVAFQKIVEELLDQIVARSYLSFGDLRDAISQNNLKLPDLTRLRELVTGDLLLRIDRHLAGALDGIHHRGPVYLRWSHQLSALAFGTRFGRFVTQHLAIPFGGAFLAIEGLGHIVNLFVPAQASSTAAKLPDPGSLPVALPPQTTAVSIDVVKTAEVLLLGIFLLMLMEHAGFRGWCLDMLRKLRQTARRLVYDLPVFALRLPWVRWLLDSPWYTLLIRYLCKPVALTACFLFPFWMRLGTLDGTTCFLTFLAVNGLLNSPLGRYADEVITEQVMRGLRGLQIHVLAAGLRLIIDLFQWILQAMERFLYAVDEWLLFRSGEGRIVLGTKAVLAAVWSVINYVVRIYITLLIEPQVNPIKHFPVVTVSHKIMLPFAIPLTRLFAAPLTPLFGRFLGNTIAGTTVFLLPGVFGFLVWELKENWRLYAANRSKRLMPIPIGGHGETMSRLLRLRFHSGTIPRLFSRLRSASHVAERTGQWGAVHKQMEGLRHVAESARRYVERELLCLLAECRAWRGKGLAVEAIDLAVNQVSIALRHPEWKLGALRLVFQERGGWIVAAMPRRGWIDAVSNAERDAFLDAVQGLFTSGGVDMVWERVVAQLGPRPFWHDINGDGLLIWRDSRYHSAELYKLSDTGATAALTMPLRQVIEPPEEMLNEILFQRMPLAWDAWIETWARHNREVASEAADERRVSRENTGPQPPRPWAGPPLFPDDRNAL